MKGIKVQGARFKEQGTGKKGRKSAIKGLARMPRKTAGRMVSELELIAADPRNYSGDWKRLRGSSYWRLRVGQYRAICDMRDDRLVLLVVNVGPRGNIYK